MKVLVALGLALSALASTAAIAAERCPPSATVVGDPELVSALTEVLSARGLERGTGRPGCSEIRATVTRAGDRLALEIQDGAGRLESRDAANVAIAADLVESWARMDLVAPLLEPRLLPTREPRITPLTERAPTTLIGADHPGAAKRTLAVDARAELGISDDGARWLGARAAVSTALGAFAPFLALRVATSRADGTTLHTGAARFGVDLLAGAELPLAVGPLTIAPGLAVGAGLLSTSRSSPDGAGCATDDRPSPECLGRSGSFIEDDLTKRTISPRAEASLSVGVPLGAGFSLALGLSASVLPFSHGDPFLPDYTRDLPSAERDRFGLGGEPWVVGRGMFGISWEAR